MKTLTGFEKYSAYPSGYWDENKTIIGSFHYGIFLVEIFFLFDSNRLYAEVIYVPENDESITVCRAYADDMNFDWVVYS